MAYSTSKAHRITWYVWASNGYGESVKMRHTAKMRGTWGWDAECSCGWASKTGGATKGSVEQYVWQHKHTDPDGPLYPLPGSPDYAHEPRMSAKRRAREELIARLEAEVRV